ncbi:MAG TPA: TrkA family potassium uptake protein [Acidimicrobiales bacterium]
MTEVLIVGGGKIGVYLTELLVDGGHQVRLIEADHTRAERLVPSLPMAHVVAGNGTDPEVLESAGVRRVGTVVAVTDRDETNLVITSLAKFEFGVPRTIARVNNPKNVWLYGEDMGVDVALNQADIIGHLVAEEMSLGEMTTLLKLRRGQYSLVEEQVHPDSAAVGRPIGELGLPLRCVVVGLLRGPDLLAPDGSLVLRPTDEVLAVVHTDEAIALARLLGPAGSARSEGLEPPTF